MKHYKSVFEDEGDLLLALIDIHMDGQPFELDPMYFKGNFYKRVPRPKYCFDLNPQVLEAKQADARDLPLEDDSISRMILDPPFLFGIHGKTKDYYSSKTHTIYQNEKDLTENYKALLDEASRVLVKNGILVFKCQDYTDGKTTMTHALVHNWAVERGFFPKDLAILVKPNKVYNPNTKQRHLRKIHSYFWVFVNRAKKLKTPFQERRPQ